MRKRKLSFIGACVLALTITGCSGVAKKLNHEPLKANPQELTYSFAFATMGSTNWTNGYADHVGYDDDVCKIEFKSASKQTGTITTIPVTKAGDTIVTLKDTDNYFTEASFQLSQWSNKAKTVSLQYSTDGGASFSALTPAVTSSTFVLTTDSFPSGTNAFKMVQGNASNQVGISSVSFTYETPGSGAVKSLTGIQVYDKGVKTWRAGDVVTASDLRVVASYSEGEPVEITNGNNVTITSGATLSQGSNTVNVTYTDSFGTANGSVSINAAAAISLNKIEVTTAPTNTTYVEGDTFDPDGMVVTATYSDNSTANVTDDCTFEPSGALSLTDDEVTISYTYKGVTKTTTQSITVNEMTQVVFTAGTDVGTSGSNNSPDTVSKSGVTIYGSNAAFATAQYRIYQNCELTISLSTGNIKKITFVESSGSNPISNLSLKEGESGLFNSSTGIWTGMAESVTFVASAQARANSITVEKAPTTPQLLLDKTSISLKTFESDGKQVTATVYNVNNPAIVFAPSSAEVTIEVVSTSQDGDVKTVAIKPNTSEDADLTVQVTVTGTDLSGTIEVQVRKPLKGETADNPYSASEAKAAIAASDTNIVNVYIEGIVSQIDGYYESSHSINYWISDDGTTTDQFKIYAGKGLNGASFTSVDDLLLGDHVIVYGTISKQHANVDSGSKIVSLVTAAKVHSIELTPSAITLETEDLGDVLDLFTNINIIQDQGLNYSASDIEWSSDNDDVIYFNNGQYLVGTDHRTSTTIHASINGVEYGSATVYVIDPNVEAISYNKDAWVPVSNPTTLKASDKIILTGVKADVMYAAGTYAINGNNVPACSESTLTITNGVATGVVEAMVYTLETGTANNSFALKDSTGNYLFAAGASSNNYMKTQSTKDGNSSFVFNADGTIVAQGSSTRNYMRYNNDGNNNLFSCYGESSTTGDLIKIYKQAGGYGTVDTTSVQSVATVHGTEVGEPGNITVTGAYLEFSMKISVADWTSMENTISVADYGLMLFRTTEAKRDTVLSVKEYFELDPSNVTIANKGNGNAPAPDGDVYEFSIRINVNNTANYSRLYCVAPFILAGGQYYFFEEMKWSINTLAESYWGNDNYEYLSDEALLYLATAN